MVRSHLRASLLCRTTSEPNTAGDRKMPRCNGHISLQELPRKERYADYIDSDMSVLVLLVKSILVCNVRMQTGQHTSASQERVPVSSPRLQLCPECLVSTLLQWTTALEQRTTYPQDQPVSA
ncbi:Nidogen-2 [Manis pentadactyla]|nr:Nidogen-2 [Manis pentadactyla]